MFAIAGITIDWKGYYYIFIPVSSVLIIFIYLNIYSNIYKPIMNRFIRKYLILFLSPRLIDNGLYITYRIWIYSKNLVLVLITK